jgi:hypothetical protein
MIDPVLQQYFQDAVRLILATSPERGGPEQGTGADVPSTAEGVFRDRLFIPFSGCKGLLVVLPRPLSRS